MNRMFACAVITLASGLAACDRDAPEGSAVEAGPYEVSAAFRDGAPQQEDNRVRIDVRGPDGGPMPDAWVEAVVTMPAMGAMPEMRAPAAVAEAGNGAWLATFDLPMRGSWTLAVDVAAPAGTGEARWSFTVGTPGLTPLGGSGSEDVAPSSATPSAAPSEVPPAVPSPGAPLAAPVRTAVAEALEAYEAVRDALAADTLAPVPARRVADALGRARATTTDPDAGALLDGGIAAANTLVDATDLAAARRAFGELSRALVALGVRDPALREGRHVFRCPMAEGFQRWIQPSPTLENPYMGTAMPTCGSPATWEAPAGATPSPAPAPGTPDTPATGAREAPGHDEIAHYTCPMHPSVKSETPGQCPICGMDLTPVTEAQLASGTVIVDPVRRQQIGVTTAPVIAGPLRIPIRAVGTVTVDEAARADVTVRAEGWVERLYAAEPGQRVERGEKLFSLYSPELYAAQAELLQLAGSGGVSGGFARAARERLRLWGLTDAQIDAIVRSGEARERVDILAPRSGYVLEKHVVEGARVAPGDTLFRIAGLDQVWVEAQVYEGDLPFVRAGQPAAVRPPTGPALTGTVARVLPVVRAETRSGTARIELPNDAHALLPGMWVDVELVHDAGERLVVPQEAVIYTGPRRLVFVDRGEGRLKPREIEVGLAGDDVYEVTAGLAPGEIVVISGNFLVAAESRLRSATNYWGGTRELP